MILEIRLQWSGLSTLRVVPGSPHFYEVHRRGSLPSKADGGPYPELPRRLAHFGTVRGRVDSPQSLGGPGAQDQSCQELSVSQPTEFIPKSSFRIGPHEGGSCARLCTSYTAARLIIQLLSLIPSQSVSKDAGPHDLCNSSTSVGPSPNETLPVLVETSDSAPFVASWKHLHQGETGLHSSPCPLEGPSVVRARREDGIGLHKEGCLDRYFQNRLGRFVRGQSDLRLLVESGRLATHQLPRNDSSMLSSSNLSAGPERTPRVIYESPR